MADHPKFLDDVPVGRIFLALEIPRHESFETEERVIALLCDKEDVYPLARDIVKHGLNPLERFALVPIDTGRGLEKRQLPCGRRQSAHLCAETSQ